MLVVVFMFYSVNRNGTDVGISNAGMSTTEGLFICFLVDVR